MGRLDDLKLVTEALAKLPKWTDELGNKYARRDMTRYYFDCPTCQKELKANNTFFPPHRASSRCQSGGHNHCTCDTCF